LSSDLRADVARRCDVIEGAYEFTLAYAAQGLSGDAGTDSGGQLREMLGRAAAALDGLAGHYRALVDQEKLEPDAYHSFLAVLERDQQATLAAVRLVLAQPSISSQLVDNLNASIHVRALLTDLFLIDEALKSPGN
jgi:hypothetical protein